MPAVGRAIPVLEYCFATVVRRRFFEQDNINVLGMVMVPHSMLLSPDATFEMPRLDPEWCRQH